MIEAVTSGEVVEALGMDARVRMRIVSEDDASKMKENRGQWFKIPRAGSRETSRGSARMMRNSLPKWYGGEWEVASRAGELFVRSIA